MEKNYFEKLYNINVNDKTEEKNGLTYLSWAWAWARFKEVCPSATYEVVKFDGKPYIYDENLGYMVYTNVTVDGLTHEMWLPVMDSANKAMKAYDYTYTAKQYGKEVEKTCKAATMFDINKTIMRCLTKNLAMFGLGLYIYAGEDLPEQEQEENNRPITEKEVKFLQALCKRKGVTATEFNGKKFEKLNASEYATAVKQLGNMKDAEEKTA